jgi:hypothetical protein
MGEEPESLREHVVAGATTPQKLLTTLGGAATALLAIGAVIAALWAWVLPALAPSAPNAGAPASATDGSTVIRNQSAEADGLVRLLLTAARGRPVQLDHKVYAPNTNPEYTLEYNCRNGVCAQVRLEPDRTIFETFGEALWLKGCFRVTQKGAGFGAGLLDLGLFRQGDTCPA